MKKEQRILIENKAALAVEATKNLHNQAGEMQNLIQEYNSIDALQNIATPEQAVNFLSNPKQYFDSAIMADLQITFNAKVNPSLKGICNLFSIDYDMIATKLKKTYQLQNFEITSDLKIEPTAKALDEASHAGEIYLTDPGEIAEYQAVQKLCESLNDYCTRYKVHASNMNMLSPNLGLRCDVKQSGQGWELKPDVRNIRTLFKKV